MWKSDRKTRELAGKVDKIVGTESNPTKMKSGQTIINKKATKQNLKRLIEINEDGLDKSQTGKTTTDGTKGGKFVGPPHYDAQGNPTGGIPAVVDNSRNIEVEGEEFAVNAEASKKHWKELSKINQSAGNGVAIGPPSGASDEDPEEYEKGGKIQFNPNHVPNKWILSYAEKVRTKYPKVWDLGGNIFGNEAYKNLKRVAERGYWLDSEEWMYIKWQSYIARHKKDFRIAGVIAMLKWVDKVDRGWAYMKDLIEERIKKETAKPGWKHKMKGGGELIKRADGSYSQRGLWDNIRANIGSGKKPTKQMLEQEEKIKRESKYHLGGDMSKHLAPNGKPSNLTHEQWHLVRTPEFKAWFGDWEHSPETASKVVDENGEPLVVWHGTNKEFNVFGKDKNANILPKYRKDYEFHKNTNYFHTDKNYAETFGSKGSGNEKPYFLYVETLKLVDEDTIEDIGYVKTIYDYYVTIDNADGVYSESGQYATLLSPRQIKLADGSNTTFDSKNPDIRFKDGGLIKLNDFNKKIKLELKNYEHWETKEEKRKGITSLYANEYYFQNNIIPLAEPDDEYSLYFQRVSLNDKEYIIGFSLFFHDTKNPLKITEANVTFYDEDYNEISNPNIRYDDGGMTDARDTVTFDIPLLIRTLELAREDIKSDAELHRVVENLIELKNKKVLTMDDYDYIAYIKKRTEHMKQGGTTQAQKEKIAKVMHEFKSGELHSGSKRGPIVTNRDQAIAIALSEANASKYAPGGGLDDWQNKGLKTYLESVGFAIRTDGIVKYESVEVVLWLQRKYEIKKGDAFMIEVGSPDEPYNSEDKGLKIAVIDNIFNNSVRGKGLASVVLDKIVEGADLTKTTLQLIPEQMDESGLTTEQLIQWYSKRGFKPIGDGEVYQRAPEAVKEKTNSGNIEPIRTLGNGASVYFETDFYRLNGRYEKPGYLLLVNKAGDQYGVPEWEFEFTDLNEAMYVANKLYEIYPTGVPYAVLLDKYVDDIKKGRAIFEATELPKNTEAILQAIKPEISDSYFNNQIAEQSVRSEIWKLIDDSSSPYYISNENERTQAREDIFNAWLNVQRQKDSKFAPERAVQIQNVLALDPEAFKDKFSLYSFNVDENSRLNITFKNGDGITLDLPTSMSRMERFGTLKTNVWDRLTDIKYFLENAVTHIDSKPELVLANLKSSSKQWTSRPKGMPKAAVETVIEEPIKNAESEMPMNNTISTYVTDYANPYEVNRAIEKLLDMKGTDRNDYTPDEIKFISYYSGYGGLEKYGTYSDEELKGLLYEFFTPDEVVRKMWGLAYKYGYGTIADNSVLEPSVGVGAFLRYAPEDVPVVANEINPVSAKICSILYPNAHIVLQPFEKNFIKANTSIKSKIDDLQKYSLVIGNPPYGRLKSKYIGMGEKDYSMAANFAEYFITRGLDLLHPGGLLIYIVGAEQMNGGTLFLDSPISKVKRIIFDKAELVDAYRLPVNIFERTGVSSEIIVFKKK
jgi:hypothetical protein